MNYKINVFSKSTDFLERAESWLMKSEAEYNLLLGLARSLANSKHLYKKPIFLATVELNNEIKGCAFRTPPYKFGLSQMPLEAIEALVKKVLDVYEEIPAVLGPEVEARRFAEEWSSAKKVSMREGIRQRIFELTKVDHPKMPAAGKIAIADLQYLDLISAWLSDFQESTGLTKVDPLQLGKKLIDEKSLFLWMNEGLPQAMAGTARGTENGKAIAYVFTPKENRNKGYASTLTAALSQRLLDDGLQFCFLYTDLSNSTSNSIYQKIGYRPVADVMDFNFDAL